MPSADFFRHLGFFVVREFLEPQLVANLLWEMKVAPKKKAAMMTASGVDCVDEDTRKVQTSVLSKEIRVLLEEQLFSLIPGLERHFNVALAGCESPHYLVYGSGDFFKPHADGGESAGKSPAACRRRISAVIFLNRESKEPAEGTYGNGCLTFYGLLDGPQWERCALPLNPETGLLIAFPADKIHEVTPVSHGKRFTVATWFYAADTPDAEPKRESSDPVGQPQAELET